MSKVKHLDLMEIITKSGIDEQAKNALLNQIEKEKGNEFFTVTTDIKKRMTHTAQYYWDLFVMDVAEQIGISYKYGYNKITSSDFSRLGGEIVRRCFAKGQEAFLREYEEKRKSRYGC